MESELWKKYRAKALVGMLFKVVEAIFELMTPLIIAGMIDVGVANHDSGYILQHGLLLVAFAGIGYCSTLVTQRMAAVVSQGVGTDLRDALFQKINTFGAAEVDQFGTPSLVTRITNDVNQVQLAVAMIIRLLLRWPILAIGAIVCALSIDLELGLIFLVCTPIVILIFYLVMRKSIPFFSLMQQKLDHISLVTREALSGVRVIRAFRREKSEEERFRDAAYDQAATAIEVGKLSSLLNPGSFLVMNLGIVAILWAGSFKIQAGGLQQGEILAFVNYATQVLLSIAYVANLVILLNRAIASARRIREVMECEPAVQEAPDAAAVDVAAVPKEVLALAFDHVSFSYGGGADALSDVTITLGQGETLGIIGGTGSGKSTFVNLISRLYDPKQGTISLYGRDVRSWKLDELHQVVALVPQTAQLVSGTIRQNLCWRKADATDEELLQALESAQAKDFVLAKESGLDGLVEAGGKNFSGGQRQRLTIARALVGAPQMVILDDAASALDFATDAKLRLALRQLPQKPTCVIVSQRVSAVMGADKILVLHHGRQIGLGTHEELKQSCELYREICQSQLADKEEAHA